MGKTKCPRCHRFFEDDFDRYVIGSITNTLKFGTHITLRLGGSALGSLLGAGSGFVGRVGGRAGQKLAEAIGCGFEDMNGWDHNCPYCKHKW